MFYVFCDAESVDGFWVTDDDGMLQPFETEGDAITRAKDFSTTSLVLRPVARVTEKTTHKVEKIK